MPKRLFKVGRTTLVLIGVFVTVWTVLSACSKYAGHIGLFETRRIQVSGTKILTRGEIIDALNIPLSGSLFGVDLPSARERVEALHYVYGVRMGRILPHTLFVDVIEEKPLAYVAAPEYFTVVESGKALPLPHGQFSLELPVISGIRSSAVALEQGRAAAIEILNTCLSILEFLNSEYPYLYHELSEVVVNSQDEFTLTIAETSTAVLIGSDDLEERLATLDAFLHTVAGKRTITDYISIDLRYNRQVVVRERA